MKLIIFISVCLVCLYKEVAAIHLPKLVLIRGGFNNHSVSGTPSKSSNFRVVQPEAEERSLPPSIVDAKEVARESNGSLYNQSVVEAAAKSIYEAGWDRNVAKAAANVTNGNITAALALLETEERSIVETFEKSVRLMMNEDWDESVARQALMSQFYINKRRAQGENVTLSRTELDRIRPTLRRPPLSKKSPTSSTIPKTVKKEDVIFTVTPQTFQSIVLESPVPVILDVYAEWCRPCQQLAPILEDVTLRAGGAFRLVKLDGDKYRALAEALKVTHFPSLFALSRGIITDRFEGSLQSADAVQAFFTRAMTGQSNPRPEGTFTVQERVAASRKLQTIAGLASMSASERRDIADQLQRALGQGDAFELNAPRPTLSQGALRAVAYIRNAREDIRVRNQRIVSSHHC